MRFERSTNICCRNVKINRSTPTMTEVVFIWDSGRPAQKTLTQYVHALILLFFSFDLGTNSHCIWIRVPQDSPAQLKEAASLSEIRPIRHATPPSPQLGTCDHTSNQAHSTAGEITACGKTSFIPCQERFRVNRSQWHRNWTQMRPHRIDWARVC